MARVLASVPQHGLEAVLVAVELVLESGVLSAEHVENVLLRIQHPVTPFVTIETDLTLVEAPLADPHRYDTLRVQESGHA